MRNFLIKDLSWKLFSLILAAVVWFTINTLSAHKPDLANPLETWRTRTFAGVPVLVVSAAADVREFKIQPDAVQVMVGGAEEIVNTLEEKEIHVVVDLADIESARYLKKRVDVSVPAGVKVVGVLPSEVNVIVPPKPKN